MTCENEKVASACENEKVASAFASLADIDEENFLGFGGKLANLWAQLATALWSDEEEILRKERTQLNRGLTIAKSYRRFRMSPSTLWPGSGAAEALQHLFRWQNHHANLALRRQSIIGILGGHKRHQGAVILSSAQNQLKFSYVR